MDAVSDVDSCTVASDNVTVASGRLWVSVVTSSGPSAPPAVVVVVLVRLPPERVMVVGAQILNHSNPLPPIPPFNIFLLLSPYPRSRD
jgi:hypothetical protein